MLSAVDHVGVAVESIDATLAIYRDALGMPLVHRETVEEQGVEAALLDVGDGHVELLQPLGPDTAVGKFLAKRGSLYVGRVPAQAGTTRVCIHLPSPGTYAIAVYHDEDANRKLNRKGIGTPAEGYGFSNNASTVFGLPNFRSVRFGAPRSDLSTAIKLKYP